MKIVLETPVAVPTVRLAVINDQPVIRCRSEEHVHLSPLGIFSCVVGAGEGDITSVREDDIMGDVRRAELQIESINGLYGRMLQNFVPRDAPLISGENMVKQRTCF